MVEIHFFNGLTAEKYLQWWERLEARGLRPDVDGAQPARRHSQPQWQQGSDAGRIHHDQRPRQTQCFVLIGGFVD